MKECKVIERLLHAWLDGELGEISASAVEEHLRECEDCAREAAGIASLGRALGSLPPVSAPEGLREATLRAARDEESRMTVTDRWRLMTSSQKSWSFASAFVGLALGVVMASYFATAAGMIPGGQGGEIPEYVRTIASLEGDIL